MFNDGLLATLPLGSNLQSNAAFIVLIANVITRLLPYDNAIYLVFVAKRKLFCILGLRRSLGILLFTSILRPAFNPGHNVSYLVSDLSRGSLKIVPLKR